MIFKVFFQFLEHQSLEDETKHACLHFFLTFAEFKSSIMKKKLYLEPIVLLLLKWMSSVEDMDLKDWNSLVSFLKSFIVVVIFSLLIIKKKKQNKIIGYRTIR